MRWIMLLAMAPGTLLAQVVSPSVRSAAMGAQIAAVDERAATVFLNPALLTYRKELAFWIGYHRPFGLRELEVRGAAVKWSPGRFAVALGAMVYGNSAYEEWEARFAAAADFHPAACGLTLRRRRIEIARYGRYGQWLADLGADFRLSERARLAALVRNAFVLTAENLSPPAREWLTAAQIRIRPDFHIWLEIAHQRPFAPELRIAAEARPLRRLALQAGTVLGESEVFAVGLSLHLPSALLEYAVRSVDPLPATHLFAVNLSRRWQP